MSAIEDWNAQYGSLDDYTRSTGGPSGRFAFTYGVLYPMRIRSAKVITSKRGDVQVEIDLDVLNPEGEVAGQHREWITLPKQESDRDLTGGVDQIVKVTLRRRDDLGRILSRVDPSRYALYKSVGDRPGGGSVYFDFDGAPMSNADMDARQVEINARVMEAADALHDAVDEALPDWVDAEFYLVKQANPKSDRYPYTNYYAHPVSKLPVWSGTPGAP